jgi:hypothetical protein
MQLFLLSLLTASISSCRRDTDQDVSEHRFKEAPVEIEARGGDGDGVEMEEGGRDDF